MQKTETRGRVQPKTETITDDYEDYFKKYGVREAQILSCFFIALEHFDNEATRLRLDVNAFINIIFTYVEGEVIVLAYVNQLMEMQKGELHHFKHFDILFELEKRVDLPHFLELRDALKLGDCAK